MSAPSTPLHQQQSVFSDQVYSNLMYLDNKYYGENSLNNSMTNEDIFASCVKSLTSKFSEMHTMAVKDDDNVSYATQAAASIHLNSEHNTHTLPMNKRELNSVKNCTTEPVNISSSSSSTESMPFANDNAGTIRTSKKNNTFLQNALKFNDDSVKHSSSSSSSSSTSSPMFAKNVSLPNSTLNSPLTPQVANHTSFYSPTQPSPLEGNIQSAPNTMVNYESQNDSR